jgi:hypothetical protein
MQVGGLAAECEMNLMKKELLRTTLALLAVAAGLTGIRAVGAGSPGVVAATSPRQVMPVPGMPPVLDAQNLYSEIGPSHLSPVVP